LGDDEDDLFDSYINANKAKETSLPIKEMDKLNIKDNNNTKPKPAEKTGGLKDLLNTNTNSNKNTKPQNVNK